MGWAAGHGWRGLRGILLLQGYARQRGKLLINQQGYKGYKG